MKIQKVTLRNYRRHEQLEVSFAADRTLIHGPNEIGKSSLIEAIHRCLFYRHKSRAAGLLERMQPRTGGDPEVTIEFATGGVQYTLQKKFRGPTGSRAVLITAFTIGIAGIGIAGQSWFGLRELGCRLAEATVRVRVIALIDRRILALWGRLRIKLARRTVGVICI